MCNEKKQCGQGQAVCDANELKCAFLERVSVLSARHPRVLRGSVELLFRAELLILKRYKRMTFGVKERLCTIIRSLFINGPYSWAN